MVCGVLDAFNSLDAGGVIAEPKPDHTFAFAFTIFRLFSVSASDVDSKGK